MSSPIRSTKAAAHEKIIADFAAAAQYASVSLDKPRNADRNDGRTSGAAGLASNNVDAKLRRGPV